MRVHTIYRKQVVAMPLQDAWDFFSSPYHLNAITPDFFHITITSAVPDKIYAGLLIRYTMKAVFDLPMQWLSEICHCDEGKRFVYQQKVGPFAFWSHEVCLTAVDEGVVLEDTVFYTMPLGLIGECLHRLLIVQRLSAIFDKRAQYLQQHYPSESILEKQQD